jgi:hypothetical protein
MDFELEKDQPDEGEFLLDGEPVRIPSAMAAQKRGERLRLPPVGGAPE